MKVSGRRRKQKSCRSLRKKAKRIHNKRKRNILRPDNTFTYAAPGAPSVETVCP